MQVAMSLSDTPDAGGPEGFTKHHAEDATVYIARTLISAGAAIAYGGDFRPEGYTPLLAQLIQTYNQTATKGAQDLHSYLSANIPLGEAPENVPLSTHHLKESPEFAKEALLPDPSETGAPPDALYVSDMRRVMAKHTAARVILGGNANPRAKADGVGYGGRYPGLVEEAWRTLEAGKPLYVVGGFGGAAALVADLLEREDIPKKLQDSTWPERDYPLFAENARVLDAHPMREKLGLPKRMEDLAKALWELGKPLLQDNQSSIAWNGLSVEENKLLLLTRDPVILAALVSKGLLQVARKQGEGKLQIELVRET
jgi:hypothetical protein